MMSCCCLASPAPRSYSRRQQQADLEPQQLQQHLLFKRAPGAAVNINIVQRFFDVLNPQLHGLLKTNLDNFQLENTGFDIPVPLVGDIHFEATNMKVVNASVIAPSVITIKDGGVNVKFDDIAFKLIGDYTVTWGKALLHTPFIAHNIINNTVKYNRL